MLAFQGSRFQYFLSVSPQEGPGRGDLSRWILEAQRLSSSCRLALVHTVILRASAASRKACLRPQEAVPGRVADVHANDCYATVRRPTSKRRGWQDGPAAAGDDRRLFDSPVRLRDRPRTLPELRRRVVFETGSAWPDLLVAGAIGALALTGASTVLKQARLELRSATS